MSLSERVTQLNQFVDLFFDAQNDSSRLKEAWHERSFQAQLALLLAYWRNMAHHTTLKVGVDVGDTTVQWNVMPASKNALQLGGCSDDGNTHVLGLGLPHAVARLERGSSSTYLLHAQVEGETWVATGYRVPSFTQAQTSGTGVILQTGSMFRVGEHVFQVRHAPRVRRGNIFTVAPTCVDLRPAPATSAQEDLESSEQARCTVQCVAPLTTPLLNKMWNFEYGKGGTSFALGTSSAATVAIPLVDILVSPIHCVVYSTYGYFWLLDNNSGFGTYYELFPSAKPLKLDAHTTPVHLLLGGTVSLTQASVMVV